ncbi:T6SS effector amidase Tae4 family protein [Nitrospirillum sp. BR 11163]|uniref:T6SS effector amidase Tae4 family protein n=1 Tax=Nitrospirillum sp. BR 11163 TaxID=3104323 RepID=UPI002AFE34AF|nr:T6SS effector amidase Tae4 family protein [Nitrospirillum sp. BR 11163]MEA1674151.1 T6SS effector amidase Tae4 family protein [Nitrospirillum sp. BR 11163]
MKSNFNRMWAAFPDHATYPTLKDLYTWLGGAAANNINEPGFGPNGNTCASRMSVALNQSGVPILSSTASAAGARTIGTADGSRIIYAVSDLRTYLRHTLGKPSLDNTSPFDDAFLNKQGIIAFSVNWSNATGHIALWNGSNYREPSHDNYAAYVDPVNTKVKTSKGEFWELP